MAFRYMDVEAAMTQGGVRMVVVGGVPSGWGEAAKGILHAKGIDWVAVRLRYDSDVLRKWIGGLNGPIAIFGDEPPRNGWAEILLAAERYAPQSPLLPRDATERATVFGLSHELCGEQGLGWARRLQLVHGGLRGEDGFSQPVAGYLGKKYGYDPERGAQWGLRVEQLLRMLAARLHAQHRAQSPYYVSHTLTAVDIYSACFMAMFDPLPPNECDMDGDIRAAFESRSPALRDALDPVLLAHRDMVYQRHLALPLSL